MTTALLILVTLLGAPSLQELIDTEQWDAVEARLPSLPVAAQPRVEGLIAQARGNSLEAARAFERALTSTPEVPQLHLHAAHAYLEQKRFKDALRHARAASALSTQSMAQPMLEARALTALNRDTEAYVVLQKACRRFKDAYRPRLELAVLAQRKQLGADVRRLIQEILERTSERAPLLALFHLLYGDAKGLVVGEQLVARYPKDPEFRGQLGHLYAGSRRWLSAARLFESATTLGGRYAFEAADQYRMAGHFREALRLNGQLASSLRQRTQRVAILFEQQRYGRIVAMNPSFDEPGSRYRVAYSHYAVGDHTEAARRARVLLDSTYRAEAIALLDAMRQERVE